MSVTRLVCPHCEQSVEVNVTSVTRARDCPRCGKSILIQVPTKTGASRHKALLTPTEEKAEPVEAAPVENIPRALDGDPRNRLMHDPEVRAKFRMLKIGGIAAGGLLLILVLAHVLDIWSAIGRAANWLGSKLRSGAGQEQIVDDKPELPSPNEKKRASATHTPMPDLFAPDGLTSTGAFNGDKGEQNLAVEAVKAFLSAKNFEERMKHVRDRSTVARRMQDYYSRKPEGPVEFERIDPVQERPMGDSAFVFSILMRDGSRRQVLAGKSQDGRYTVDWPSFVLYSEMDWEVFRETRPTEPKMFRAFAASADFFQGAFADRDRFLCVKLLNPLALEEPAIFGYVQRGTALASSLENLLKEASGRSLPVIVRLKYPPGSKDASQTLIHELVTQGWVSRQW